MGVMFIGLGTLINVVMVAAGAGVGLLFGSKIPERTRHLITTTLGLVTFFLGISMAGSMNSAALKEAVGNSALVVLLAALLIGAIIGSTLRLEARLEWFAEWLRDRFARGERAGRFVDAIVTPTLLFCVGPLTILGALNDGLGRGPDQLIVKSVLDGFSAIAFASSLGVGVLFSAIAVGVVEGCLTLLGFLIGDILTLAQIDALTAAGGVLLMGLALRLLDLKRVAVGDLLPALLLAPLAVAIAQLFH